MIKVVSFDIGGTLIKNYDRYKISSMVLEKDFLAKVKVKQMINKRKMV